MAKLVFLSGEQTGREFELSTASPCSLGRSEDCEIQIENVPGVSRRHARVFFENGEWIIEDAGSQNGIYIDKERVTRHVLHAGDVMWLSQISLRFDADQVASAENPSASDETSASAVGMVRAEDVAAVQQAVQEVEGQFSRIVVGQKEVLAQLLTALLAGGHCLMIGLPGLAKTLMVETLSRILDLKFKRIQFTPDLMPSDIVGSDVLEVDEETGAKSFRFIKGPIFTNMLLADEINRTPPKTQAALLEAMQEHQVSVSNQRFPLPAPFFTLATQNPLEQEGTYPLPEAQLDRFMFNILVEYPDAEEEEQIVLATTGERDTSVHQVLTGARLVELQQLVRRLPVSRHVVKYATRLARATRPKDRLAPEYIQLHVACGAGPRAAQYLVLGAKAHAVLAGRLNVACDDVRALAAPILRHRIFTNFTADSEGITPDDLIQRLLLNVEEPGPEDY